MADDEELETHESSSEPGSQRKMRPLVWVSVMVVLVSLVLILGRIVSVMPSSGPE